MVKDKGKPENNSAAYRDYTTKGGNRYRKYTFNLNFTLIQEQMQLLVFIF